MSVDFLNGGSLYIQKSDGDSILLGENVYGVTEVEMSADEVAPIAYNLNSSASLSFEMKAEDLDLLNSLCGNLVPTGEFILQYEHPIMIQARWHKKARIRKKWLKRYGMKPDIVKVDVYTNAINYNPIDGSFDFEEMKRKYILRPDQRRGGIKIEW